MQVQEPGPLRRLVLVAAKCAIGILLGYFSATTAFLLNSEPVYVGMALLVVVAAVLLGRRSRYRPTAAALVVVYLGCTYMYLFLFSGTDFT